MKLFHLEANKINQLAESDSYELIRKQYNEMIIKCSENTKRTERDQQCQIKGYQLCMVKIFYLQG